MRQDLVIPDDKKIGDHGIAANLIIQHFLESHQIVGENLICGIELDGMGQIFGLGRHRLEETAAVTLGDQY